MAECRLSPVRMLVLTVTGRCNFACRYCYAVERDQVFMTEDTALAALDMAKKGERFLLQFTGGEPLLHFPLIQKVVRETEKRGLDVQLQIQTNGSLLTRDIARWLYRHKVGIGLSLDGRPEVNDRLRLQKQGGGTAAAVSRGFAALRDEGIAAGITCTVTEDNVDDLEGIADMAYFYGNVRQVGFDILRQQGRGIGMKAPTAKSMEEALKRTTARVEHLERLTGIHVAFTQENRVKSLKRSGQYDFPHCYAMNGEAAFVDVHGDIYACSSLMGDPAFALGHVKTGREADKVHFVGARIRKAMAVCQSCGYFSLCGGGCFSRWYNADGQIEQSVPECAMKQFFIRQAQQKMEEL